MWFKSLIRQKHHLEAVVAKWGHRSGSNLKGSIKSLKYTRASDPSKMFNLMASFNYVLANKIKKERLKAQQIHQIHSEFCGCSRQFHELSILDGSDNSVKIPALVIFCLINLFLKQIQSHSYANIIVLLLTPHTSIILHFHCIFWHSPLIFNDVAGDAHFDITITQY